MNALRTMLAIALCLGGVSVATAEMTARVRSTAGGPQIFVNGQAVPPRMFWGTSGARPHRTVGDRWQSFEMAFASAVPTDRATIHLRFKQIDGGCTRLRNFRVDTLSLDRSFDSESAFRACWNVWDPARQDAWRTVTNGVCELSFSLAEGQKPVDYHFHSKFFSLRPGERHVLSFEAQGLNGCDFVLPNAYSVSADGVHHSLLSGREANTLLSTTARAAEVGVDFVSYGIPSDVWGEKGDDYAAFDALTRSIIEVNPKVRLIPRVSVNAPVWWLRQHPDHRMQFAAEHVTNAPRHAWSHVLRPDMASVSSRLYRQSAVAYIRRFCRHAAETFPENFAGIHPTGQNTHEWFYFDSWDKMNGYDPETLAAFRAYLNDPNAEVPTVSERMAGSVRHHLLDPKTQGRVLAFNRFQQREMSDFVAELARACRQETDGKKLVLFFYGYAYEFASHRYGPANSGHYGLENLLKKASDSIDILCSPISYSDRAWCGATPNMSCGETVMRRGILWLNEDDSRTYLDLRSADYVQEGSKVTAGQSCQVTLRNTACEAVHGFGSWWMDLPGWGWYDSDLLWARQKALNPLEEEVCRRKNAYAPELALIQDEESMLHVRPDSSRINGKLVSGARKAASRSGVPHGQYLLCDILERPISAKLQVFQSCWCLSDKKVAALIRQKATSPAWRVWCWAAGAGDENGREDLARMSSLAGFRLTRHDLSADSRLLAKATSVGLASGLKDRRWYGAMAGTSLAYSVADARPDEIWAVYPNGDVALAVRKNEKGGDIFLGVPELTSEMLHAFAKVAGAHTYLDAKTLDKVFVQATAGTFGDPNGGFGLMQAQENVSFDLHLPVRASLTDALTKREIGRGADIPFNLKKGDVRVFRWSPLPSRSVLP